MFRPRVSYHGMLSWLSSVYSNLQAFRVGYSGVREIPRDYKKSFWAHCVFHDVWMHPQSGVTYPSHAQVCGKYVFLTLTPI